jgi:glucose-6-phosphate dehydrogenase assembly protein OpcA
MSARVEPERLLRELAQVWVQLGQKEENGVLRACAQTLITAIDESYDPMTIGETLAALMPEHPSRSIVVRLRCDAPQQDISARVWAQCWMPFGRRQQICCEQIEITAGAQAAADVGRLITGLLAADLPVALYAPVAGLLRLPGFERIVELAGKIIVDSRSGGWPTLRWLAELPDSIRRADLAWAAITPWRETIAQLVLEDAPALLGGQVIVCWVGEQMPTTAAYLAAWLEAGLQRQAPGAQPLVVKIETPTAVAAVRQADHNTLEVQLNDSLRRLLVPEASDDRLLREELAIWGRDVIFEKALRLVAERFSASAGP